MSERWEQVPIAQEGEAWESVPLADPQGLYNYVATNYGNTPEGKSVVNQAYGDLARRKFERDAATELGVFWPLAGGVVAPDLAADFYAAGVGMGSDLIGTALRSARTPASLVGLGDNVDALADHFHRAADSYEAVQSRQGGEGIVGDLRGAARGALRTIPPALVAGRFGGAPAAIGQGVAQQYSKSLQRGEDAGLAPAKKEVLALNQAVIEGGIASTFQAMGLGGLEKTPMGRVATNSLRNTLKSLGWSTVQEVPEEVLTELYQNTADAVADVDPTAAEPDRMWESVKDTTLTTIATMGLSQGPSVVGSGLRDRALHQTRTQGDDSRAVREQDRQALSVPDVVSKYREQGALDVLEGFAGKPEPSRKDWDAAGLPVGLGRSGEFRAKFAADLRAALQAERPLDSEVITDEHPGALEQEAIEAEQSTPSVALDETIEVPPAVHPRTDEQIGVSLEPDHATSVLDTIKELMTQGGVAVAGPDWKYTIRSITDDGTILTKQGKKLPLAPVLEGKWAIEALPPKSKGKKPAPINVAETLVQESTPTNTPLEATQDQDAHFAALKAAEQAAAAQVVNEAQNRPITDSEAVDLVPPVAAQEEVVQPPAAPVADSPAQESAPAPQESVTATVTKERPEAPGEKPAAKEPWQMTRAEFAGEKPVQTGKRGEQYLVKFAQYSSRFNTHPQEVKQALAEGKPVPPEVLSDYPDLQPKEPPHEVQAPPAAPEGREGEEVELIAPKIDVRRGPQDADDKTRLEALEKQYEELWGKASDDRDALKKELHNTRSSAYKKKDVLRGKLLALEKRMAPYEKELTAIREQLYQGRLEAVIDDPPTTEHAIAAASRIHEIEAQKMRERMRDPEYRNDQSALQRQANEHQERADSYTLQLMPKARSLARGMGLTVKSEVEEVASRAVSDFGRRPSDFTNMDQAVSGAVLVVRRQRYAQPEISALERSAERKAKGWGPNATYENLTTEQFNDYRKRLQEAIEDDAKWQERVAEIIAEVKATDESQRLASEKQAEERREKQRLDDEKAAVEKAQAARSRGRDEAAQQRYWRSVSVEAKSVKGVQGQVVIKLRKDTESPFEEVATSGEKLSDVWAITEDRTWHDGKWIKPKLAGEKSTRYSLTNLPSGKNAATTTNPKSLKELWVHGKRLGIDWDAITDDEASGKAVRPVRESWDNTSLSWLDDELRAKALATVPPLTDVPFTADVVLRADDLGTKPGGSTTASFVASGRLKAMVSEVAEFRYNPVFTVDSKKNLVFRDGYKFTFPPDNFNLAAGELTSGQTIGIDLADFGIAYATEQDVVAEMLEGQAFSKVAKGKDGTTVTAVWQGRKITVTQVRQRAWKSDGDNPASNRANQTIERIRWTQPGQADDGPSKGKAGPIVGEMSSFVPKPESPKPSGKSSWQEDHTNAPGEKPKTPKKSRGKKPDVQTEPKQAYGPSRSRGGTRKAEVPLNLTGQSTATRQVSAHDIVQTMAREFDVTLKYGRVPGNKDGMYFVWSEVARVAGDEMASLAVESHEIAHDVDKKTGVVNAAIGTPNRRLWGKLIDSGEKQSARFRGQKVRDQWGDRLDAAGAPANIVSAVRRGAWNIAKSILQQAAPQTAAQSQIEQELAQLDYVPGREDLHEGFAEFTRHYLTTGQASQLAPNLTKWFENEWLPKQPQYGKGYKHAQELIDQYRAMTPEQRAVANRLTPGETPQALDVPLGEQIADKTKSVKDKLITDWSDRLHIAGQIDKDLADRGFELGEQDNTIKEVLRWADQTLLNLVNNATVGTGIWTIHKGKQVRLSKSLVDIFAPLKEAGIEESEWDTFHLAQHILDIEKIYERKNAARHAAGQSPVERNNGMTYDEARAIVARAQADPKKYALLNQASTEFAGFRNAILDMRADSGEITQKLADFLKEYYARHASMRRVHPNSYYDRWVNRGGSLNVGGRVLRRSLRGSGLPIMPQVDSALMDLMQGYHGSLTTIGKQTILGRVVKNPSLGFNGIEGLGYWAQIVDPNLKPQSTALEEVLTQLVKKNVIEQEDADNIRAVNRLRGGTHTAKHLKALEARYGTSDIQELLELTKAVPSLDDVLVTFKPDYRPSGQDYIERQYVKGKPILVEWNPLIYEMFANLGPMELSAIERGLAGVADLKRLGATGLNWVFGARQLSQDYMANLTQAKDQTVAEALYKPFYTAGQLIASVDGIRQLIGLTGRGNRGQKMPSIALLEETYGSLFEEHVPDRAGMQLLHRQLFLKGALPRLTEALKNPSTWARSAHNVVRKSGHLFSLTDLPARLAEGQALLKKHGYVEKKDDQGVWRWYNNRTGAFEEPTIELKRKFLTAAADVTNPFSTSGVKMRYLNRVYFPYLNPSVQGFKRMADTLHRAAKGDKRAIAGVLAYATLSATLSLLARALSNDDEEQEKEQWYKSSTWSTDYVSIRKPHVWSLIPNIVEAALDMRYKGPGAWVDYAREELRQASYFEIPLLDEDPVLGNVAKVSGVGPVAEAVSNRNTFRNRNIEPGHMQGLAPADRFDTRTGTLPKAIGQVTGPALNLGPKKVEHILEQTSGGMLTRQMIQNPFRAFRTSESKKELDDKLQGLEAKRKSSAYHGAAWTPDDEFALDRMTSADETISALYRAVDAKQLEVSDDEASDYAIGLARFGLGKEPLDKYPDPFRSPDKVPKPLRDIAKDILRSKYQRALQANKPFTVTAKEKADGLTIHEKQERWRRNREAALRLKREYGQPSG